MPPRIESGTQEARGTGTVPNEELLKVRLNPAYEYPYGDMRPGSPLHEMILDELKIRSDESFDAISQHHSVMEESDRLMSAFIHLDDKERAQKDKDKRRPVPIVVPASYAIVTTVHTQYMALLTAQEALYRFQGRGPEDTIGAILLEKVLNAQASHYRHLMAYSIQAMDMLKYGFGAIVPVWEQDWGSRSVETGYVTDPMTGQEMFVGGEYSQEPYLNFEGCRLRNANPYQLLTDPNVPITNTQDGEFFGFEQRNNRMNILSRELQQEGWFNGRYLQHATGPEGLLTNWRINQVQDKGQIQNQDGYEQGDRRHGDPRGESKSQIVDETYLTVTIVPSEWKAERPEGGYSALGSSEYPEKWQFCVAGDQIVLYAAPLARNHNRYEVGIAAPESDGYTSLPIGLMDITRGTQKAIDFQWNTLQAFQRKMLRGRFVGDPAKVNISDLAKGSDFIRVTRTNHLKTNFGGVLEQLTIQDPTPNNLVNMGVMHDLLQRASGATDPIQGIMRTSGERRSAEEARGARLGALSRVERLLLLATLQSHQDLSYILAFNTQQYMSEPTYVKIMGRWEEELLSEYGKRQSVEMPGFAQDQTGFFPVHPREIDVPFDVVPIDATNRGQEYFDSWISLYGMIIQNPYLIQTVDMLRLFKHIARLGGARNVSDFLVEGAQGVPRVLPDNQVQGELEAGNVLPVQELMGMGG